MPVRPSDRSLSVILPALDEEQNIVEAVEACTAYLAEAHPDWEVIVVDDGSADGTAELVRGLAADEPRVRIVSHASNRGYGAALATGFAAARHELVFFTDADLQFDVRELSAAVPLLDEHDVVFGFRVYRYDSVMRCILSWTYNRLVRWLFGIAVRDVDCSFKLFTRQVVARLQLESTDFFVDTEIVGEVARMPDVRTVELGVRHYPRRHGRTTVRPSHIPLTLLTLARIWWRTRRVRNAAS